MRLSLPLPLAVVLTLCAASTARAEMIGSSPGLEGLGSFTGSFEYTFSSSSLATLTVELTNTSPAANGGYLTAFAFNNPGNRITSVSLSSTDSDFGVLGGGSFNNGIKASPFGYFDIGASVTGSWLGGGSPHPGIGVGQSATFTFTLGGTGLDTLTVQSFFSELSVLKKSEDKHQYAFAARFRGFCDDGSDKVPGELKETPEPATALLAGLGAVGLLCLRRRKHS